MDIIPEFSTDPERLDTIAIHNFLSESAYWARGRSLATVQASIRGSLNFAAYHPETKHMLAYARAVTDRATMYYLADVFVLPEWRGRAIGRQLIQFAVQHPDLARLTGLLVTKDAAALYHDYGFRETAHNDRVAMMRVRAWLEAERNSIE